jgi:23S rRNA pseudouridine1911/1915/1917 synthase
VTRGRGAPPPGAAGRPGAEPEWREYVVRPYEDGRTVASILTDALGLKAKDAERAVRSRGVRLNRRPAGLADVVRHADTVALRIGEPTHASGLEPLALALDIVHADDAVLVINKPAYLLVHPTQPGQGHTLVNALVHHYQEQGIESTIHPVHRLDRDTSGLLLVARTPAAHRRLSAQLGARTLKREYLAIVSGVVQSEAGVIDAPIGPHPTQSVLRAVRSDGEPARTHYRVVERYPDAALVALELETGRTHQIRVHMTHLGHPLIGDRRYGRRGGKRLGRQALHAARISFEHPASGVRVSFDAELPADMQALREELRRR